MADTDIPSETATPEELKNGAGSQATDSAEVERLRKQAEQAQMRVNQLEKEKADRLKKEEEAERKQLEEKEEYKTLAERERSERERLERERETERELANVKTATTEVFKEYSKDVVELAETMGLSLTEDSSEGRKNLKDKLDKLAAKVHPQTPSGNNGYTPPPAQNESLTEKAKGLRAGTKESQAEFFGGLKSLDKMREQAGLVRN